MMIVGLKEAFEDSQPDDKPLYIQRELHRELAKHT